VGDAIKMETEGYCKKNVWLNKIVLRFLTSMNIDICLTPCNFVIQCIQSLQEIFIGKRLAVLFVTLMSAATYVHQIYVCIELPYES